MVRKPFPKGQAVDLELYHPPLSVAQSDHIMICRFQRPKVISGQVAMDKGQRKDVVLVTGHLQSSSTMSCNSKGTNVIHLPSILGDNKSLTSPKYTHHISSNF